MDAETAATVQAISTAAYAVITVVLAVVAVAALRASNRQAKTQGSLAEEALRSTGKQAEAASAALVESRRDRHLTWVPILKVSFEKLEVEGERVSAVMHLQNRGNAPVLNVHTWLTDCVDRYQPNDLRISIPTPVPMIGRDGEFTVPVDLSRFPRAGAGRTLRTDWVYVNVTFEGLLGAIVTEEWYWEPDLWEGLAEPVPGHGEKLILYRVKGTSGAEPNDIDWQRRS